MAGVRKDNYANMASAKVDLADGTITFTELNLGISLGAKLGIIIDEIDYFHSSALYNDLQTDEDFVCAGWCTSNALTSVEIDQKGVIHREKLSYLALGTPGNGVFTRDPHVYQFFPPIIVAAPKIYLFSYPNGTSAGQVRSRMMYRYIDLKSEEYLEIAESFILVG